MSIVRKGMAATRMTAVSAELQAVTKKLQDKHDREVDEALQRPDGTDGLGATTSVNTDTHFVQPKISGYRQLTPADTLLINEAEALGNLMMDLHKRIVELNTDQILGAKGDNGEHDRLREAEPHRWASLGKTHIQQGVMCLVRAVAQPTGV